MVALVLRLMRPLVGLAAAGGLAAAAILVLTGQTARGDVISLFGLPPQALASDGICVYAPRGSPVIDEATALAIAAQEGDHFGGPASRAQLVRLRIGYPEFDGLAWAVAFDVAGTEAAWPAPDHRVPYRYSFAVMFLDAKSGDFLMSLAESAPVDLTTAPATPGPRYPPSQC